MNCERWDTILPGDDGCLEPATHRADYADGVTLHLCGEHAAEAEERGVDVARTP